MKTTPVQYFNAHVRAAFRKKVLEEVRQRLDTILMEDCPDSWRTMYRVRCLLRDMEAE